jgi:matrixin
MKLRLLSLGLPVVVALILIMVVRPAFPFLPEATGTGPNSFVADTWPVTSFPIDWQINNTISGANIAGTPSSAEGAIVASFATWVNAPNTAISVNSPTVNTSITDAKQIPSNVNFVCFICTGGNFGQDGTLAVTSTTSNSGQITQSFILFNPNATTGGSSPQPICLTVAGATNCPKPNSSMQDMQTVATHEMGHFFGLDHSGIVRAMMFPFAPTVLTTLSYDDVAGISTSYPNPAPVVATGSISGTISMANAGSPVFGAHVFANSTTGNNPFSAFSSIRKTPIGTLTVPNGTYTIQGVPADSYVVIAEPLDQPVDNTAIDWGLPAQTPTFHQQIQINFTTRWH